MPCNSLPASSTSIGSVCSAMAWGWPPAHASFSCCIAHFDPLPFLCPAFERRARIVPTEDVPHRRSRRHRDRGPHVGCTRTQVRPSDFLSYNGARSSSVNYSLSLSLCLCSNFMRQQAMASKMVFNRPVPVNRLVSAIADSASSLYLSLPEC
jgi:hypothetical protein